MKRLAIAIILVLSLLAAGCSGSSNRYAANPGEEVYEAGKDKANAGEEIGNQNPGSNQEAAEDSRAEEDKIFEGIGIYTGLIDNNSVEIKLEGTGEFGAYRVENAPEFCRGIKSGDRVKIKYTVNEHNQNMLLSIEKI